MEQQPIDFTQPKRPGFLSTLCILTFIGAGLILLFSLMGVNKIFFTSEDERAADRQQEYEQMEQAFPDKADAFLAANEAAAPYERTNWLISFFCNLLTLAGAVMMWQVKKTGFYLYAAGEILPYLLQYLLAGGEEGMKTGMAMASMWVSEGIILLSTVLFLLFDAGFIVMYGLNYKRLN